MKIPDLKPFFISIAIHVIILLIMLLFRMPVIKIPEKEVFREVSFVVEREFPKVKKKERSKLAQARKPLARKTEAPKAVGQQKIDQKPTEGDQHKVELPEVEAPLPSELPESDIIKPEQIANQIQVPQQSIQSQTDTEEVVTKELTGGDFGAQIVDIRPSKNIEIFGPIVNRNIVYSEIPEYPDWAKRKGIETEVRMKFWVHPNGDVFNISIVEKSGYIRLDLLAKNTLGKWSFTPLEPELPQVVQWGEIVVRFILY